MKNKNRQRISNLEKRIEEFEDRKNLKPVFSTPRIIRWIRLNLLDRCPECNTKLFHWSWEKWKCERCKTTFYS